MASVLTARTSNTCSDSYGESLPPLIRKEQINNNTDFGNFSFPEFLCQNVTAELVHRSRCTSLRTLAGCWALPKDSLFVPVCEGVCSNRSADRFSYSSGFCASIKFAPHLLTLSKDWRKPPTVQPSGAALGQSKPCFCTTDPWEAERDVERGFGFPRFKKEGRGVGAARKLTYPGAGEPAHSPVLTALLESRAAASAAAAGPGVFLLHHPVLQPSASQRGVHRKTIT